MLRVHGKGDKTRYLPLHPGTAECMHAYLEATRHGEMPNAALFQRARGGLGAAITPDGVYKVVLAYAAKAGIHIDGFGGHVDYTRIRFQMRAPP